MKLNRRVFLGTGAAAAASLSTPAVFAAGAGKPRVVVVGGGAGGATAARYIANDSKGAVDVTLIEPSRTYFTCFFSNLYLGGIKQIDDLGHNYGTLAGKYGINVVHDWAVDVDRSAKTVSLAGGAKLPYDKLILSPGIDFVDGAVEGWDLSHIAALLVHTNVYQWLLMLLRLQTQQPKSLLQIQRVSSQRWHFSKKVGPTITMV